MIRERLEDLTGWFKHILFANYLGTRKPEWDFSRPRLHYVLTGQSHILDDYSQNWTLCFKHDFIQKKIPYTLLLPEDSVLTSHITINLVFYNCLLLVFLSFSEVKNWVSFNILYPWLNGRVEWNSESTSFCCHGSIIMLLIK